MKKYSEDKTHFPYTLIQNLFMYT